MEPKRIVAFAIVIAIAIAASIHLETHLAINNTNCTTLSVFNATTGNCTCTNGSIIDAATNNCICPANKPWLHMGMCTPCSFPSYFNNINQNCYICPSGYSYNATLKYCVVITCPPGQFYNSTALSCVCPSSIPYFYNSSCHICALDHYYLNGSCHACWLGSYYNSSINYCSCNKSIGYFPNKLNATACILCLHPNYFNDQYFKCLSCPVNQTFNIITKKCQYCPLSRPLYNGI